MCVGSAWAKQAGQLPCSLSEFNFGVFPIKKVVCVCSWVCACVEVHVEARGQPRISSSGVPSAFIWAGFLVDLEITSYARLVGQKVPGILLSLLLHRWDCKCMSPSLAFVDRSWGQSQVLSPTWQALSQLSHPLSHPVLTLLFRDLEHTQRNTHGTRRQRMKQILRFSAREDSADRVKPQLEATPRKDTGARR